MTVFHGVAPRNVAEIDLRFRGAHFLPSKTIHNHHFEYSEFQSSGLQQTVLRTLCITTTSRER
jgi:hypothetical protein